MIMSGATSICVCVRARAVQDVRPKRSSEQLHKRSAEQLRTRYANEFGANGCGAPNASRRLR